MPLGYKDPGSLAAEIKMSQTIQDSPFLIVEGRDDRRFWLPRCQDDCEIVDGEGKKNVVGCIQKLDGENFRGALGVTDDDYDSLMGTPLASRNLVTTETHDLECLLIRSPALETVLAEFGVPEKINEFENASGVDVRTAILDRALNFGRLRWAAYKFQLDIDRDAISVARFVSSETWEVDYDGLIRAALQGSSESEASLRGRVESLPDADPWLVAQGHDMVGILRRGLQQTLGEIRSGRTGTERISQVLRSAFSDQHLQSTMLAEDILRWEAVNPTYPILKRKTMFS